MSLQTNKIKMHLCTQSKKQHNKQPYVQAHSTQLTDVQSLMTVPEHLPFSDIGTNDLSASLRFVSSTTGCRNVTSQKLECVCMHQIIFICVRPCTCKQKYLQAHAAYTVRAHTFFPFFVKIKNPIDFYFSCFRY